MNIADIFLLIIPSANQHSVPIQGGIVIFYDVFVIMTMPSVSYTPNWCCTMGRNCGSFSDCAILSIATTVR